MALFAFPLSDQWLLSYRQPAPALPLQRVA
jgi:hypothetical protein